MKTWGIILISLGAFSTIIALIGAAQGYQTSFGGITFLILGAFLLSRANKKKEAAEKRKRWEENR